MENQDVNESLQLVFDELGKSLRLMSDGLRAAMSPVYRVIAESTEQALLRWVESFSKIDLSSFRDMSDNLNIEFGNWEAVSPEAFDRITPEQRWNYQRWVWGAPKRWVRRLYERLR